MSRESSRCVYIPETVAELYSEKNPQICVTCDEWVDPKDIYDIGGEWVCWFCWEDRVA